MDKIREAVAITIYGWSILYTDNVNQSWKRLDAKSRKAYRKRADQIIQIVGLGGVSP